MKKNNRTAWIVGGIAAVAALFWWSKRKKSQNVAGIGRLTGDHYDIKTIGIPNFKTLAEVAKKHVISANDGAMYVCYPYVAVRDEKGGNPVYDKWRVYRGMKGLSSAYKKVKGEDDKQMLVEIKKRVDLSNAIKDIKEVEKMPLDESFPYFKEYYDKRLRAHKGPNSWIEEKGIEKMTPFSFFVKKHATEDSRSKDNMMDTYKANLIWKSSGHFRERDVEEKRAAIMSDIIKGGGFPKDLREKWLADIARWIAAPHIVEYCKKKLKWTDEEVKAYVEKK